MKVIYLIVCFLLAYVPTCSSQEYPSEKQMKEYQEIKSLYPPELVAGFPEKLNHKILFTAFLFPRGAYFNYIHLAFSMDKSEIESLKTELSTKSIGIYHFTDTCLMPIPYDYDNFKVIESDSLEICQKQQALPITNIRRWGLDFTPKFYEDATIYVLDVQKGRFLDENFLSKSGVGLPKKWLHGYTKGVTIFKNYAIYWLEVW